MAASGRAGGIGGPTRRCDTARRRRSQTDNVPFVIGLLITVVVCIAVLSAVGFVLGLADGLFLAIRHTRASRAAAARTGCTFCGSRLLRGAHGALPTCPHCHRRQPWAQSSRSPATIGGSPTRDPRPSG